MVKRGNSYTNKKSKSKAVAAVPYCNNMVVRACTNNNSVQQQQWIGIKTFAVA